MIYENLPIYKLALNFCVYIEIIVRSFDKYHKYTIGQELRNFSKEILFTIYRANALKEKREMLQKQSQVYNGALGLDNKFKI